MPPAIDVPGVKTLSKGEREMKNGHSHPHCDRARSSFWLSAVIRPSQVLRTRLPGTAAVVFGLLNLLMLSPGYAQNYKFESQFGGPGSANGQFNLPRGVAIDPTSHNIVVTDCVNDRVQIFDSSGMFLSQFGSTGSADGQFRCPSSVAIDPANGDINVLDAGNNRVQVFTSSGMFANKFGSFGTGPGQFSCPGGIAIDPMTRNKVVNDVRTTGTEVLAHFQTFNSSGGFSSQFTGTVFASNFACAFGQEAGVAIDPTSHDILYSDSNHDQLQIFSSVGMLLNQFGTSGIGNRQFDFPAGIAIDPVSDNVIVADSSNNRVQVLSLAGEFLSQFGGSGSCNGRLNAPIAVAVDPTTENIVVVDSGGVGDSKVSIYVPTSVPVTCASPAPALSERSLLALTVLLAMTGLAMVTRARPAERSDDGGQTWRAL